MKKTLSLLLALALAFSLCACGESSSSAAKTGAQAPMEAPMPYPSYEDAYIAEPAEAEYDTAYQSENGLSAAQGSGGTSEAPSQRPGKIIYSANVQVESTDFDGSIAKLGELIETYEGWVESSSVNGSNYADRSRGRVSRRSASYTLRIPAERFDALMGTLSDLGNVPYTHVYTENVTAQYYDVQARLNAFSAQEQRLLEMMELAESVEDVIILEDRLTEVRYRIESLQSTLNNWDRQVSYSTVYLDITEVQEYSPEPQVQPSYGQQLRTALKDGLEGLADFFQGLLLVLAASLPTLLVLGAVIAGIVVLVKKSRKKRRAAREAARKAKTQPQPEETLPEEPRS